MTMIGNRCASGVARPIFLRATSQIARAVLVAGVVLLAAAPATAKPTAAQLAATFCVRDETQADGTWTTDSKSRETLASALLQSAFRRQQLLTQN